MTEKELIKTAIEEATKSLTLPDDLKMENVKSAFLDKEFPMRLVDNKYYEITHDALEDALLHNDAIKCEYIPVKIEKDHAVVECIISCGEKSITKVGEAMFGNLRGAVQQNIPASTAYMRAFDRAMIRMLAFETPLRVYSSMELSMCSYFEGQISRLEYQLKMLDEEVLRIAKSIAESVKKRLTETPQTTKIDEEKKDNVESVTPIYQHEMPFSDVKATQILPFSEEEKNEAEAYKPTRDTILLLGNCKGMRLEDAVKTPKWNQFLTWVKTYRCYSKNEEVKKQAEYFKEYAIKKLGE